jgi:protein-disulfide isomerase
VLEKNPKTVKLVYKNFPLPMHKFAFPAALAGMAANEQGKFWEFHDRLFAGGQGFDIKKIEAIAKEVGLDMNRFKKDMASPAIRQQVIADIEAGRAAGVRGTPSIFVNGHLLKHRSPEAMQALIDQVLAKAKQNGRTRHHAEAN